MHARESLYQARASAVPEGADGLSIMASFPQVGTLLEQAQTTHEMLAGAPHKRGKIVLHLNAAAELKSRTCKVVRTVKSCRHLATDMSKQMTVAAPAIHSAPVNLSLVRHFSNLSDALDFGNPRAPSRCVCAGRFL